MRKLHQSILLLLTALLLIACSSTDNETDEQQPEQDDTPPIEANGHNEDTSSTDEENGVNVIELGDFFLPDGTTAYYEGVGNEFAELIIDVHRIGDQFVVVDEDNGGVTIRKVFRIEEDAITVLTTNPIDLNEALPEEDDLVALEATDIYLQTPLEVGEQFGNWTIIETNGTIETPYGSFNNVLIIESIEEDLINRRYLVQEYGEIVRESIMETEEEEDFIVISSLQSIE